MGLVLDPHISYKGLKDDYADDVDLLATLEGAKLKLHDHYSIHYANASLVTELTPSHTAESDAMEESSLRISFTAHYKKKDQVLHDKLEEYFKLPPEEFDGCDPLKWWLGQGAQFPKLFHLACDILTIPGMLDVQ